jgi:2-polyprenyl-3-methyl-5-hydroxy-6-metoxy-1,4-benzoquinol methylase
MFEYNAGLINKRTLKTNAKRILQNLKKINPSAKTILDIGSGYGLLLNEAHRIGLHIQGIEPSIKLFKISRNEIQSATENMSLDEYIKNNPNSKFDLVTAVHVIEHVNDPVSFINLASTLVNPGGVLYIETPNIDSYLFHYERDNYTFLTPPEHVCLLSKYSFKSMSIKNLKIKMLLSA